MAMGIHAGMGNNGYILSYTYDYTNSYAFEYTVRFAGPLDSHHQALPSSCARQVCVGFNHVVLDVQQWVLQ